MNHLGLLIIRGNFLIGYLNVELICQIVLQPGLNLLIPIIQKVAYKHTLKEEAIDVTAQTAISNDNVTLSIDGVLYVKIVDPVAASYGVNSPYYAITHSLLLAGLYTVRPSCSSIERETVHL